MRPSHVVNLFISGLPHRPYKKIQNKLFALRCVGLAYISSRLRCVRKRCVPLRCVAVLLMSLRIVLRCVRCVAWRALRCILWKPGLREGTGEGSEQNLSHDIYPDRPITTSLTGNTRGIQKVRSLTQLTTEYAHVILSLFNIVPSNRNALGPAFLQSLDSIVEEFLILVL